MKSIRKLIQVGGGSLGVTIDSNITEVLNLEKGQLIEVDIKTIDSIKAEE